MAKGLLMTVGASADSEIFCINHLAPEWVAFLCTVGSRSSIDRITEQTALSPSHYQVIELPDSPDATGAIVLKAHEALRWLEAKCGDGAEIAINPTAGRKWMSMALGLFGSRTSARQVYVDAKFREGKPDPETMRVVDLGNAQDYTGLFDADLGVNLFNRSEFDGAMQVFEKITPKSCAGQELYRGLAGLAKALHRWDRFEHYRESSRVAQDGMTSLDRVKAAATELQLRAVDSFLEGTETLLRRIGEVETGHKPSLAAVVDLAQNAHRRIAAGRLDDGVARLYRALEATAQFLLFQRNIDTSQIDWSAIPEDAQQAFRKSTKRDPRCPLPRAIGLKQAFSLAQALRIPGAEHFFNQQGRFTYDRRLEGRNHSILAHGWNCLTKDQAEAFLNQLKTDLKKLGGNMTDWEIYPMPRLWT